MESKSIHVLEKEKKKHTWEFEGYSPPQIKGCSDIYDTYTICDAANMFS